LSEVKHIKSILHQALPQSKKAKRRILIINAYFLRRDGKQRVVGNLVGQSRIMEDAFKISPIVRH